MSVPNITATRFVVALAALLLCGVGAHTSAQTPQRPRTAATPAATPPSAVSPSPSPAVAQSPAREVAEDEADLAIIANVTARELKFEVVPNPVVEFTGRPARATAWEAERTNLPHPVQPGVTYRDIGIRLKIVSVFADIDRIVAEALGEVPATADTPPPVAPPVAPPTNATPEAIAAAPPAHRTEMSTAVVPPAEATAAGREPAGSAMRVAPPRRIGRARARRLR